MTAPTIPAATLIVMRDRNDAPPELLMVERSAGMTFAGGAMVFPGGRIDAADEALAARYGHPDAAARIAAIRETIEESSVGGGMAPTPDPRPPPPSPRDSTTALRSPICSTHTL